VPAFLAATERTHENYFAKRTQEHIENKHPNFEKHENNPSNPTQPKQRAAPGALPKNYRASRNPAQSTA
jgi:hypothetical protein